MLSLCRLLYGTQQKLSIFINVFNTCKRCKKLKLGWIYPTHLTSITKWILWFLADVLQFYDFPAINLMCEKYKEKMKTCLPKTCDPSVGLWTFELWPKSLTAPFMECNVILPQTFGLITPFDDSVWFMCAFLSLIEVNSCTKTTPDARTDAPTDVCTETKIVMTILSYYC